MPAGLLPPTGPRREVFETTLEWSLGFLDRQQHLAWSPSWYDAEVPPRAVHLTPNTAWLAYGLLLCAAEREAAGGAAGGAAERAEAVAMLERLLGLQLEAPGEPFDGTYARFPEAALPPSGGRAVVWRDYDPNWRQFVGTTLALVLEDAGELLPAGLLRRVEASIGRACRGEPPDRIALDYTNPGLMHAWLLTWYGRRCGDPSLVAAGRDRAAALVRRFEELGAFQEYNSPTYYGIDLYALALWQALPADEAMAAAGERLAAALWAQSLELYDPGLHNWCGPYTRTYGPDATRSVTLLGLWYRAVFGAALSPLPPLGEGEVHHGNDMMAGPVIARLAPERPPSPGLAPAGRERLVRRQLGERLLTSWIGPGLLLGAEASGRDWEGSHQFVPLTAHFAAGPSGEVATVWLADPHVVRAEAAPRRLSASLAGWPAGAPLRLCCSGWAPRLEGSRLVSDAMVVELEGELAPAQLRAVRRSGAAAERELVLASPAGGCPPSLALRFHPPV